MKKGLFIFVFLGLVLLMASFFFLSSFSQESLTGHATGTGTVTLTQAGSAGVTLGDGLIAFGSGYYNGSCSLSYADVNSNTSKTCWVNTTAYFASEDVHVLSNSGSTFLNVTVAPVSLSDAEQFFCGSAQGCLYSTTSAILLESLNSESGSCIGLTTVFETFANNSVSGTLGVCDALDFVDASDAVKIYTTFHVPKDASVGNKTLFLDYEAVSL